MRQDMEQGKRRSKAHLCGKLYNVRSCHDWALTERLHVNRTELQHPFSEHYLVHKI